MKGTVALSTSQPNILIYDPNQARAYADLLRRHGYHFVFSASTRAEAKNLLPNAEVLLCWKFPVELFSECDVTALQWVQSMGAGVNDLVEYVPKHATLTRVVDQFGGQIAEYVFAYLLYLAQDIDRFRQRQTQKAWEPQAPGYLAHRTLGVAGLGSIGQEVVRKARSFDMNVYGLSFTGTRADRVDSHYFPDMWSEFVRNLDYLVLTLPLTKETQAVINRNILQSMKPESVIVNVGRGPLIVEADLVELMRAGHIRAAVLDVFEKEPLSTDSPLWSMPNVYVTPHIAAPSVPSSVGIFLLDNLHRYVARQGLLGVVNLELGY